MTVDASRAPIEMYDDLGQLVCWKSQRPGRYAYPVDSTSPVDPAVASTATVTRCGGADD